jgi:hypothetical protein
MTRSEYWLSILSTVSSRSGRKGLGKQEPIERIADVTADLDNGRMTSGDSGFWKLLCSMGLQSFDRLPACRV